MVESRIVLLKQYAQGCDFFASLLLDLPDDNLIDKIVKLDFVTDKNSSIDEDASDVHEGEFLLASYIQSCEGRDKQDILQEISVDRTRLLCGLTKNGPQPPYESLYRGAVANDTVLSVSSSYRAADCRVAKHIKDAPDHLGVEISFLSELCVREADALECGNESVAQEARRASAEFMSNHLGCWVSSFCVEMLTFATTNFYRAVAHLLKDFIDEGKLLLAVSTQ